MISYYSVIPSSPESGPLRPTVTIALRDNQTSLNAKEIAQALWGKEAEGDANVAWSPSGVRYTQEQIHEALMLVEKLEQLQELEQQIGQTLSADTKLTEFIGLCQRRDALGTELKEKYPGISALDKFEAHNRSDNAMSF